MDLSASLPYEGREALANKVRANAGTTSLKGLEHSLATAFQTQLHFLIKQGVVRSLLRSCSEQAAHLFGVGFVAAPCLYGKCMRLWLG